MEKEVRDNEKSSFDNSVISWVADEYPQHTRGLLWKVLSGLFIVTAIILGIVFNSVTFSLAIASFALVYYLMHKESPKKINIILSSMGVKIGNKCIVGANSFVNNDMPSNSIVLGTPAKIVGKIKTKDGKMIHQYFK